MDFDYLRSFDLRSFLKRYSAKDVMSLRKKYGEMSSILSTQITLYDKAREKLPELAANYCYFSRKSLEQSSSEPLARFKSGLFTGNKMLDLTGGLGVDDKEFSTSFTQVTSIDIDKELNGLARINFEKLGISNIERLDADAYEYIKANNAFDLIYVDADRRQNGKRKISLDNSEPNAIEILSRLFELSTTVLLKLSPLIDLRYLEKNLPGLSKIYVAAYENEVKEVLAVLQKNYDGKVIIIAVDLFRNKPIMQFSSETGSKTLKPISSTEKYFYEPSVTLIKAGLTTSYAAEKELSLTLDDGIYLTGDKLPGDFMGRAFRVTAKLEYGKSAVKNYLKLNKIIKANVSSRNFIVKAKEIRKVFKIKDGGDDYLFFTKGYEGKKLMYHCRKL